MTDAEKIAMTKALVNNDANATDSVVTTYLSVAQFTILSKMYPFGYDESYEFIPREYEMLQCQLAARYFTRTGAEGETQHTENGVSRTYESVDDSDLLKTVISHAKVV